VNTINRRARRLIAIYGLGVCVILVVTTAFVMGLADYLLRFEDPGVRFLSSIAVVVVLGWSIFRFLYPAIRYRPTDVHIAQHIEQQFPQLKDRLSSSIEFIGQSEENRKAGSVDLRRAVVARTAGEIERLDFAKCVDTRRPWRAVIAAAAICLVGAVVCCLDTGSSIQAAHRLAMPWMNRPWPRRNNLEFTKRPMRIALGSDFEVELVDRNGRLPDVVNIHYWFDGDDRSDIQEKEMKFFGDHMVHRLENVRRPFWYRAAGGDDTTDWIAVEVVEPPSVEVLQIRLFPPEYTGWPVENSGENVFAVEGTIIEAAGRLSKPASAVALRIDDREVQQSVPVHLADDGMDFRVRHDVEPAWIARQSGTYWFETIDPEGLHGGADRRWNIRVAKDAVPTVSLEKPGATAFATRDAAVAIGAFVKDDLAIHTIVLRFHRSDAGEGEMETVEIYRGPDVAPRMAEGELRSPGERGDSRSVDCEWDLSRLSGLEPGGWIDFSLVASDYKPQEGESAARRLTIISQDELEERIAARQSYILGQLVEVLRVQREARSQTKSLEIELDVAKRLDKEDVDQLQSAELNQRQVARLLSDPNDGVTTQIVALLDELESNHVDCPEVARRMNELLRAVEEISRERMPVIQRDLIGALKIARASMPQVDAASDRQQPNRALADSLSHAGHQQDEVIAALERLLGELTEWDSYRRFSREISRVRETQQEIAQETEKTRLDTLGKERRDLDAEETANLKRLAERQTELARRFDKILSRMDKMHVALEDTDPLAAETLADALDVARRTAVGGQMREGGRQIEHNRVGQATETQKSIARDLQDLLDTLANRREHELDRRVRKLNEATDELKQLQEKVKKLREKVEDALHQSGEDARKRELQRLAREQKELAEQTKRLARRLERLQAERSADLLDQASSQLDKSAAACEQGEGQSALEQMRKAEDTLEKARQQLDAEKQKAQRDLSNEQMARLEQEIAGLAGRQRTIIQTTSDLEGLRTQRDGRFTRGQLASVGDLARGQRMLATETAALADRIAQAKAFALALRGATREMDRAARGLQRSDTGESTQRWERNALVRLEQLQKALKRDNSQADKPPDGQQPGGEGPQSPPSDAIQRLAELKLLKLMQEEINRRTIELEDQRKHDGGLSDEELEALDDLATEQGRLADLTLDLTVPVDAKPEDEPDGLMDLLDEGSDDSGLEAELKEALDDDLLRP